MGERTRYEPGTFCWVGLAAADPAGAKAFYADVFGWRAEDAAGGYAVFSFDGKSVALLYPQTDIARAADVVPHWTSFVSVEDADAASARAVELGGALPRDVFEVADAGRVATVRDPTGAIVALWEPRSLAGAELVNDVGCFCWNELATSDPARARSFYGDLLGWEFETGATGYATIMVGGDRNGGIRQLRERDGDAPPSWTPYFTVASARETARAAEHAGAKTLLPPTDLGHETIAAFVDPQGAAFVIFEGPTDP